MAVLVTAPPINSHHHHIDLQAGALERRRRRVRVKRVHSVRRGIVVLRSRVV
jgi:hypothetical protein